MSPTNKKVYITLILLISQIPIFAQQFVGLNTTQQSTISHLPTNPSWVAHAKDGDEVLPFAFSAMAGNNAFGFSKGFIMKGFDGAAVEGVNYFRTYNKRNKNLWANIDIVGPSVMFNYKKEHNFGIFTRMRQVYRAGGISDKNFHLFGTQLLQADYNQEYTFNRAGFTTHSFAEVGLSYGKELWNDYYHIIKAGVSVKYLMGFVAGSIQAKDLNYYPLNADTVANITGDINTVYTFNAGPYVDANAQNDLTSWYERAGRGGLGLDIGIQYEFHPDGNPNIKSPYLFRIAASLTDIGSIKYIADTGSGTYSVNVTNIDTSILNHRSSETYIDYLLRLDADTSINIDNNTVETFRVGLPTALRVNTDYNMGNKIHVNVNLLLNLRGNSKLIYKPSYLSYLNFTPMYTTKAFSAGLPITIAPSQGMTIGAILQFGPLYIGSSSILSSLYNKRLYNIDIYTGVAYKFKSKKKF